MIHTLEIAILIGIAIFIYLQIVKFILDNFKKSDNFISKLFWLAIMFFTLSFLFGSYNNNSYTGHGYGGGYDTDHDHYCNDDDLLDCHNDFDDY